MMCFYSTRTRKAEEEEKEDEKKLKNEFQIKFLLVGTQEQMCLLTG